ncbi:MAG TPA: RNA pyrophosphohydrolase [Devosiaceae bacterium]|jgi:putative (di)nucleoside polyphosphate hydrolase
MPVTKPNRESMPYRDCVGIALFNHKGQVFIGRRMPEDDPEDSSENGAPWQMPQGGIDKGEEPLAAARRELEEETNVTSARLIAEAPEWIYYDLPDEALGIALKGKYRGQRQRWFAFSFTGEESEINVLEPGNGAMPAEFDAWRWEELSRTPELIVAFKHDAYVKVVAAFAGLPQQLANG